METIHKLRELRKEMQEQSLDAFLQPVGDEYMSEYPPESNRRVEWLTAFSGSAGTAVVLAEAAALFTDGRYTLQAKNEVDAALFEQHNSGVLAPESWLADKLRGGARVGYDARMYTRDAIRRMQAALAKKGIEMVGAPNLIDAVWRERPAAPSSALFIHEAKYAGETALAKRKRIAAQVAGEGADAAIISAPDAVCWLLNIRGRDVENTPLALATAIIGADARVQLFVSPSRVSPKVVRHLGADVTLAEPVRLEKMLVQLGEQKKRVLVDPASAPVWFSQVLSRAGATVIDALDPCLWPKALKNAVELQGIRNAHIRDGAAVAKLLCWLESEVEKRELMELDVVECLRHFRSLHELFIEPSFNTISGAGPHGAIVHYRATEKSNRALKKGELFLLDSGGQYPDGTTDITRTVAVGKPSAQQKDRFTRVLKGHIALACAVFPEGTTGGQLDVLARQYLWEAGLDYDHGTGHGVGCFLGVHEGPQRIGKRGGDAVLTPGMIISNEPGYYKTGAYGIRVENLVAVVAKGKGENGRGMLAFETVTCAPIDTRLVAAKMLLPAEKKWLNAYHAWVVKMLSPHLHAKERVWLRKACAPIK